MGANESNISHHNIDEKNIRKSHKVQHNKTINQENRHRKINQNNNHKDINQKIYEEQYRKYVEGLMNKNNSSNVQELQKQDSQKLKQYNNTQLTKSNQNLVNYNYNNEMNINMNLNLNYDNINDTIDNFYNEQTNEKKKFEEYMKKKEDYFKSKITDFENNYDPYKILDLNQNNELNIDIIKKSYKKKALIYHPDKCGNNKEAEEKFRIITQAYLYLLKKFEEQNINNIKFTKKVEKVEYIDAKKTIDNNKINKFIDKDNFNLDLFNEVFEKYKIPDLYEDGYNNLLNSNDIDNNSNNQQIFSNNFNKDIFNKTFQELKKNKFDNYIIEHNEPEPIYSNSNYSFQELGIIKKDNYGYKNNNGMSYTDYKEAHIDGNLLINEDIPLKTYKDLKSLEYERSNINYKMSNEDKIKYDNMLRRRELFEEQRIKNINNLDKKIEDSYNRFNTEVLSYKK